MAVIQERVKKNGKTSFTVIIRIKGHRTVTKTFDRKTDAKDWANSAEAKIKEGVNFPKRKLQKLTMNNLIDKFIEIELPKKKEKAQKEFIRALDWFRNEIGELFVRNITSATLVECREKLVKKPKEIPTIKNERKFTQNTISPATVNRYLECISVVFSFAKIDLDIIDINPMEKVKKLPENNERTRFLELDEINKLLLECKKTSLELYLCTLIALLCGARKSEILKLTWANVDFEHKMLYFMETKNGTNRGTPMHDWLYSELYEFKNNNKVRHLKNDYVFVNSNENPNERLIGKVFPKIVAKCGIKNFVFHDLRHTHASYQAMDGISQFITQKTLGHKTPVMTNRYSHLRAENLRKPIETTGNTILQEFIKSDINS